MLDGLQRSLYTIDSSTSYRVSSWDRSGGNADFLVLQPGQACTLADLKGPGCIRHCYCTMIDPSRLVYRKIVLRMWWGNEQTPSVEVPLGDFFCIGNCLPRPVNSLMMAVNPGSPALYSHGLNCYFPMPFASSARIELEYQSTGDGGESPVRFWYHIEAESLAEMPPETTGYFHAQWRREKLTRSIDADSTNVTLWGGVNLDGAENYVILEAKGRGQVAGLHLQVDNIAGGWYGEGDDMVFVDGEGWPPSYHGTGTEEVFGGGACPNAEYSGPYTGFHLVANTDFSGKNAMYRWYVHDPIKFRESVRMSIEHGHANNFENDYSSVAYWYQLEPHAPFPQLLPAEERLPRFPEAFFAADRKKAELDQLGDRLAARIGICAAMQALRDLSAGAGVMVHQERFEDACDEYDRVLRLLITLVKRLEAK